MKSNRSENIGFLCERNEMAGIGNLRRAGQAVLAPLLARQTSRSLLGAARVGFLHNLSSSPGTYDHVPAVLVQAALAEFDFLMTPLQHVDVVQEDQTMAVLSPIGWPSGMLIEDGTKLLYPLESYSNCRGRLR